MTGSYAQALAFLLFFFVVHAKECNIQLSLEANDALEDFLDIVEDSGVELAPQCLFLPENNQLTPALNSYRLKRHRYKCKLCTTNFRSEEEIIYHVLSSHSEVLEDHTGNVCLGDLCDIVGCESTLDNFYAERKSSMCSDTLMQKTRYECYGMFKSCFSNSQKEPKEKEIIELSELFQDLYCNRFYCAHENEVEAQWEDPQSVCLFFASFSRRSNKKQRKRDNTWWYLQFIAFVLLISMMFVYYIGVILWQVDSQPNAFGASSDFRRLNKPNKASSTITKFFGGNKSKTK